MARNVVAELGVAMTLDSAQFNAGLKQAEDKTKAFERNARQAMREADRAAKELANTLGKVAAGMAVVGAAFYKALEYADQVSDTAKAFDITVGSLLKMQKALDMAGNSGENFTNMMSKLAVNADKAREGSDEVRKSFERLGIAGIDVEKLAPDELFNRVAYALSQVEDPVKRNALAFELLGKAAKGTDWKEYWENYSQGKDSTEKVSVAIEEAAKAWDNLKKSATTTLQAILVLFLPLTKLINSLAESFSRYENEGGIDYGEALTQMSGGQGASVMIGATPVKPTTPAKTLGKGDFSKVSDRAQAEASVAEQVRQQTNEYLRQINVNVRRQQQITDMIGLTKNEQEILQATNKIEEDRLKIIADANKEIEVERAKGEKANKEKIKALQDQIKAINEAKEIEKQTITEMITTRQEEQKDFVTGWKNAYRQYLEDSENYAQLGATAFKNLTSTMENALSNFITTGKFNFQSFATSIINEIVRIEIRMQASKMLSSAGGFLGGLLGLGNSSINGSGLPSADVLSEQSFGGLFADGGQPPVGKASIVGENGPELFVPRSSGTIIPNQQLSSALGNQPQVVYNAPVIQNMSAIDTQSGLQFLAKNKNAIWAANQSAARSVPTNR